MINFGILIDYLNTITDITDITGNRIFFGLPDEEQTETYVTLNIISETNPTSVQQRNRIEFRCIGGNTSVKLSTLQDLSEKIYNALFEYKEQNIYKVVKSNNYDGFDEKKRKVYIRDLFIYYTL